jgi:acetyl esterase/lipase
MRIAESIESNDSITGHPMIALHSTGRFAASPGLGERRIVRLGPAAFERRLKPDGKPAGWDEVDLPSPTQAVVYKRVGDVELALHVFEPPGHRPEEPRPGAVFFFGGGWVAGTPRQFFPHCRDLARLGMVAMAANYRVHCRHKTSPFECVEDAKSAIRWIRAHAGELGVDPQRLAAGGGSAGGHIAAAAATLPGLNAQGESLGVNCVPDALLLFNPVYDNGPGAYGFHRVRPRWREISPAHHVRRGMPPAITLLGTRDHLIRVATAERFQRRMQRVGSFSELVLYDEAPHGFFNYNRGDGSAYRATMAEVVWFIRTLGWLAPDTTEPQTART